MKPIVSLLKQSARAWSGDGMSVQCAALAFYTVFAISPLLLVTIAIAGFFFGTQSASNQVFSTLREILGETGARAVEAIAASANSQPGSGTFATAIGILTAVVGAFAAFNQVQDSLNLVWKAQRSRNCPPRVVVRRRMFSFLMIGLSGVLLLAMLLISAALAVLGPVFATALPGGAMLWSIVNFCLSFALLTLLFAAIFKLLPDVWIAWRQVWVGAAVTAFLFNVGKFVIGLYLGHSKIGSSYGAAGSLVILLLWVFYSSAIFYFGAEFTREFVTREGGRIVAKDGFGIEGS